MNVVFITKLEGRSPYKSDGSSWKALINDGGSPQVRYKVFVLYDDQDTSEEIVYEEDLAKVIGDHVKDWATSQWRIERFNC